MDEMVTIHNLTVLTAPPYVRFQINGEHSELTYSETAKLAKLLSYFLGLKYDDDRIDD